MKEGEKKKNDTSEAARSVTRRHANGHGSSVWRALEQRDRLLKRGEVEARESQGSEKAAAAVAAAAAVEEETVEAGGRKRDARERLSGRSTSKSAQSRRRSGERERGREKEREWKGGREGEKKRARRRNKSGKNESIGGVFHDAARGASGGGAQ